MDYLPKFQERHYFQAPSKNFPQSSISKYQMYVGQSQTPPIHYSITVDSCATQTHTNESFINYRKVQGRNSL